MRRLVAAVLVTACVVTAAAGVIAWRAWQADRAIASLLAGRAVPPQWHEPAPVVAARARALLAHGDLDGAQRLADRLGTIDAPAAQADTLYAIGNARMRAALANFSRLPYRLIAPSIALARGDYRQAVVLDPQNWDARYNYALSAALVRDRERPVAAEGSEMAHDRAAWPDIPGAPNGTP